MSMRQPSNVSRVTRRLASMGACSYGPGLDMSDTDDAISSMESVGEDGGGGAATVDVVVDD